MEQLVCAPCFQLQPFVHRYRWYSYTGFPVGISHAVPSRHLTVMISLGDPISVEGRSKPDVFRSFAAGLQIAPAKVIDPGFGCGVGIDLTPAGARALLGFPPSAIAGEVIDLDHVWGVRATELAERLMTGMDWKDRVAVLDWFLFSSLSEPAGPLDAVSQAWAQLVASGGTVRISSLADRVGLSRRYLSGRFVAEYGLSPKQAARVLRFERAVHLLDLPRHRSLADTAATCGFFDQAHLTSEWQALAGMTPTEWLATESKDPHDTSLATANIAV
jgi:AraC-like DNA-binding protein